MTNVDPRPAVCWDTSALILWAEQEAAGGGTPVCGAAAMFLSGSARLVLSAVVLAEYVPARTPAPARVLLDRLFGDPATEFVPADAGLCRRASAARAAGLAERPARKLRTPDAIVLATAADCGAVLFSTDDDLTNLDGRPTARGVRVRDPRRPDAARAIPPPG